MTNPDYTAILLIIDRSGSMHQIDKDMEGGIKTILDEQATLPGKCTVNTVYFDNYVRFGESFAAPSDVNIKIYPRGATALYDGIVVGFEQFGSALDDHPEDERPGKVMVVVITDGLENASRVATLEDVKRTIEHQRDVYAWDVAFLGANQDALYTAQTFGIPRGSALTYQTDYAGVATASAALRDYSTTYRTTGAASFGD